MIYIMRGQLDMIFECLEVEYVYLNLWPFFEQKPDITCAMRIPRNIPRMKNPDPLESSNREKMPNQVIAVGIPINPH